MKWLTSVSKGPPQENSTKIKEQNSKCNSKQVFGKIAKFQQCGCVLAKASQNEKGCEMRGGEGLIYSPKVSSPLILPKVT